MVLKKLILTPLLLLSLIWFYQQLSFFYSNPNLFFSLDADILVKELLLVLSLVLSGIFFISTGTLAQDWKIIAPLTLVLSLIPFLFIPFPLSIYLMVGTLISLNLSFLLLSNKLKTYLTFGPATLLGGPTKTVVTILILVASVALILVSQDSIKKDGFKVPDSIIDTALKFAPQEDLESDGKTSVLSQVTPEQISLLKQNPQLLKQYGITVEDLDSLTAPKQGSNNSIIKLAVTSQLNNMIKPYQSFIPWFLGLVFFVTLQFWASMIGFFTPLILIFIFWALSKAGVTKFIEETRTVKKLVV